MQTKLTSGFSIAAGPQISIDFTGAPSVTKDTLLGIVDTSLGVELYVADDITLLGTWQGRVLVLDVANPGVTAGDELFVFVNDGRTGAGDDTLAAFAAAQHADEAAALAVLDLVATENTSRAIRDNVQNFSDRNHADLQRVATAIEAQRDDTLWTDDSRVFFVRNNNRGTITWTDISGNPSAAPGVGARPAAGDDALLDKSSYQAVNAGTGYAVGDLLDHVVTTDPKTAALVGHYWINLSAEALIAAPPAADIEPLSRLPDDAARASLQTSIGATAHQDAVKISGQLPAALGPSTADKALVVTLSTNGQFVTSVGQPTDAPAPDDTSPATLIAIARRSLARWTTFFGILPAARGQQVAAGSLGTVLASDQGGTAADTPVPDVTVAGAKLTFMALLAGVAINTLAAARALAGTLKVAVQSNAPRVTAQGNLGAANASVSLPVDGMGTGIAQITGAFVGTLTFACSFDGLATTQPLNMRPRGTAGGPPAGSATAPGTFEVNTFGMTHIVVTMTSYTSGSAAVLLVGANGPKIVRVENPATDPLNVAGTFSASFSALSYWHEAVAKAGSANIVGTSRASGAAQGQASQWAFFEAEVQSTVAGVLKIVNEDLPALSTSMQVAAGVVADLRVRAFGSSFHAEFAPNTSGTVSLSNGYVK